jgi:hypothetical protein
MYCVRSYTCSGRAPLGRSSGLAGRPACIGSPTRPYRDGPFPHRIRLGDGEPVQAARTAYSAGASRASKCRRTTSGATSRCR